MKTARSTSGLRSLRVGYCLLSLGVVLAAMGGCENRVTGIAPNLLNTVRVSLSSTGVQGNAEVPNPLTLATHNERPAISDDGRYVAFSSKASNLTPNDLNLVSDVFVRDNVTRTTTLVSINQAGTGPGDDASGCPSISGDGRFVAFQSKATNLTSDNTLSRTQIFVRDLLLSTTTLVSRSSGTLGTISDGNCAQPRISQNGRYVVFETISNEVDGPGGDDDDNPTKFLDVYRRDLVDPSHPTILISMISGTAPGSGTANKGNSNSFNATISGDGNLVAFDSQSTNLVPLGVDGGPDTNGFFDVFVRDCTTNRTLRASVGKAGGPINANGASVNSFISANGRVVAFQSSADNLVAEDDSSSSDIFIRDIISNVTQIQSVHSSGAQAGNSCNFPTLNSDGSLVAFQSGSSNLVNGDANTVVDCFVRDRTNGTTNRISIATFGGELNGVSLRPMISANGLYVVFYSEASNAADDDNNGTGDVYLRGGPF
jgi:hypothetical protein